MARRKSSSSQSQRVAAWRTEYESVLSETETLVLFKRVEAAEAAIMTRRADLEGSLDQHPEWRAMEYALAHLSAIKRDRLKFR
jgi:hypothetical protein